MTEAIRSLKPYPLGAHAEGGGIRFSFVSAKDSCGVILYDRETGKQLRREAFTREERIGRVYCKYLEQVDAEKISYLFYEEDRLLPDPYARAFAGRHSFGKKRDFKDLKAVIPTEEYDWQDDKRPMRKPGDCICYLLHVRGFTAHGSSGVKHRGCFAGIAEKIPYLKEIGVTTLELQPAYEFTELPAREEQEAEKPAGAPAYLKEEAPLREQRLNYWGYKKGFYYAPKAAYAHDGDPVGELKDLIRTLHANGMELVLQFYFPPEVKEAEIPALLRYWVLEYHVDGFRLMGVNIPADVLAEDPVLADTRLWCDSFDTDRIYRQEEQPAWRNLAFYRDDYRYTMRRFLKGDEGMLESVLYQMRHIPAKAGRIHYLTNFDGFTLADLVSYDHKHNEANGEENRDGTDYNCSWNCGEEGPSRKAKIKSLRARQIKNAMCLLLFSQSAPLIFMGDEFGNTQKGNNNPYCQDNLTAWLDWNLQKKNGELLSFWKRLTAFRREHPILRPENGLRLMDSISCGYPDLSYHGKSAWRPQIDHYSRCAGVMFCGKYAKKDEGTEDDFLYLAMNMHWESHELALPKLPKGLVWKPLFSTESGEKEVCGSAASVCLLGARSISVYVSAPEAPERKRAAKKEARPEKPAETAEPDKEAAGADE